MDNARRIGRLWTMDDLSEYLGIPTNTLYQWRSKGYGPPGRRMGKYVRFRSEDVHAWVESLDEVA